MGRIMMILKMVRRNLARKTWEDRSSAKKKRRPKAGRNEDGRLKHRK